MKFLSASITRKLKNTTIVLMMATAALWAYSYSDNLWRQHPVGSPPRLEWAVLQGQIILEQMPPRFLHGTTQEAYGAGWFGAGFAYLRTVLPDGSYHRCLFIPFWFVELLLAICLLVLSRMNRRQHKDDAVPAAR